VMAVLGFGQFLASTRWPPLRVASVGSGGGEQALAWDGSGG